MRMQSFIVMWGLLSVAGSPAYSHPDKGFKIRKVGNALIAEEVEVVTELLQLPSPPEFPGFRQARKVLPLAGPDGWDQFELATDERVTRQLLPSEMLVRHYSSGTGTFSPALDEPTSFLTEAAWEAVELAPDWIKTELTSNFTKLKPKLQSQLANLMTQAEDPRYLDELAFLIANISPEDLIVNPRGLCYRMHASGGHKIGIRAVAATGRVGYLYPAARGRWALVVRNFFVNPSGDYVDVPWDDTNDYGFAVQACNVNVGLEQFSELEYHVPAIDPDSDHSRCIDTSQVWAFRGLKDDIRSVARILLGMEPAMEG